MQTLPDRLRAWAQNEEMVDQHFLAHGRDCNAAADQLDDLLAAVETIANSGLYHAGPDQRFLCDIARAAIAKATKGT